ncbi:MAG: tyrosine-type recombinase/integrase [Saprospirales bacterium]|nr:tyrosine-type recombinase/integrase [Saprospirales bacterium]
MFRRKRKEVILEKWEMISTHTARRTFATNAHKAGVPTLVIAKITGHRTEKTLLNYIRVTAEENAMMASKNVFFGGQEPEEKR